MSFPAGSSILTPVQKTTLVQIADYMKTDVSKVIVIECHTGSSGAYKSNIALTKQQANAAKDYLIDLGIPATRIEAVGSGSDKPITIDTSPKGDKQNTRTELFWLRRSN